MPELHETLELHETEAPLSVRYAQPEPNERRARYASGPVRTLAPLQLAEAEESSAECLLACRCTSLRPPDHQCSLQILVN
jgi:hypothetical protein